MTFDYLEPEKGPLETLFETVLVLSVVVAMEYVAVTFVDQAEKTRWGVDKPTEIQTEQTQVEDDQEID